MARDDATASGDEIVLKIAGLGRRVEEARSPRPPTSPKSPLARNKNLDEDVGLDRPIRGGLTTPRDLSETRGPVQPRSMRGRRR